jgi:hypothetical protein
MKIKEQTAADPDLLNRIIHPEDRSIFHSHPDEAGAKGVSDEDEIEFRIVSPDGTYRWISYICQPVFDEDGHFLGRRGSNRDITLRKQKNYYERAKRNLGIFLSDKLLSVKHLMEIPSALWTAHLGQGIIYLT